MGLPHLIHQSFHFLKELLYDLGLNISESKLVPPSTSAVCLGNMVNTLNKLYPYLKENFKKLKNYVTNGPLALIAVSVTYNLFRFLVVYNQMCETSTLFLNRMLQLLRENVNSRKILLSHF